MSFFALIGAFMRRQWRSYLLAGVILTVLVFLNAWIPRQVGQLIDRLAADGVSAIGSGLALLLGAALVIYLLRALWRLVLFRAVYQFGAELRTRLYERLVQQSPAFFQNHRTGDLMAAATNDIDAIENAAGDGVLAGWDGTMYLVVMIGAMTLGVDWRLALAVLLPFPAMAVAFWFISRAVHTHAHRALDAFGQLNDHVQESFSGVRTVRAMGLLGRSSQEFHVRAARAAEHSLHEQRWEASYEPAVGTCLCIASVTSLGLGAYLVWHGQLTVGQLTSMGLYVTQLIWPMFAIGWVLSLVERGKAAWKRLGPLLDAPLTVTDSGQVTALPAPQLRWRDVGFAHPGQTHPAVQGVSLSVEPGQTLGLVGPTGAGKSTLIKLLLRQWNPDTGGITWGEQPLASYAIAALRQGIAWVPQEPFMFSASVAENIALAKPGASRSEVEAAARLACVYDDIARLPRGFDTPVGERGVTLSGGQRQRVAIARALLTQAPLLVLDDALSAVDTETESRILLALRGAVSGQARTVIVVAHRLSSVVQADEIVVLHAGAITERGNHGALVASGGWYARQWRYQQLQASLEAA